MLTGRTGDYFKNRLRRVTIGQNRWRMLSSGCVLAVYIKVVATQCSNGGNGNYTTTRGHSWSICVQTHSLKWQHRFNCWCSSLLVSMVKLPGPEFDSNLCGFYKPSSHCYVRFPCIRHLLVRKWCKTLQSIHFVFFGSNWHLFNFTSAEGCCSCCH